MTASPSLFALLRELREKVGWLGHGPNPNHYYCEHCGSEHEDFSLMQHKPDCVVPRIYTLLKSEGQS